MIISLQTLNFTFRLWFGENFSVMMLNYVTCTIMNNSYTMSLKNSKITLAFRRSVSPSHFVAHQVPPLQSLKLTLKNQNMRFAGDFVPHYPLLNFIRYSYYRHFQNSVIFKIAKITSTKKIRISNFM